MRHLLLASQRLLASKAREFSCLTDSRIKKRSVRYWHADLLIEAHRTRCGQKQQHGFLADQITCFLNQPLANAATFEGSIHSQVSEVGGKGPIGKRSGYSDKLPCLYKACSDDQVGIVEHPLEPSKIVCRPP